MARPPGPNSRSAIPLRWQASAICFNRPFRTFFPEDHIDYVKEPERFEHHVGQVRKHFCNRCPVRQACFEHSMRLREAGGIWGGVGIAERRLWLRKRVRWEGKTPAEIRHDLKRGKR